LTAAQYDLTMRPIRGRDELDLFKRLPYVFDDELSGDLDAGRRRPEWMWVALRAGRLVARAAWWGRPGDDLPTYLDVFDLDDGIDDGLGGMDDGIDGGTAAGGTGDGADAGCPDRVTVGVRLLETAMAEVVPAGTQPPAYIRMLPADWQDVPASRRIVEDRMAALARIGARPLVERLRLEWRPGTPVAAPDGRLAFRPVRDADELVALMTLVLDGTLDAHSRDALTRMSPERAAREHFQGELARYHSPRDWWRIATLPDGEPVGFVTPARNDYNPIIGYLAVLPAYRGRGYIDDILAEGVRILDAEGVPRIRAATDVGNVPMARAFHRAGFVTFERVIHMTWPPR
jgi:RimJ/RimL family protein N-acetyltransferase